MPVSIWRSSVRALWLRVTKEQEMASCLTRFRRSLCGLAGMWSSGDWSQLDIQLCSHRDEILIPGLARFITRADTSWFWRREENQSQSNRCIIRALVQKPSGLKPWRRELWELQLGSWKSSIWEVSRENPEARQDPRCWIPAPHSLPKYFALWHNI